MRIKEEDRPLILIGKARRTNENYVAGIGLEVNVVENERD